MTLHFLQMMKLFTLTFSKTAFVLNFQQLAIQGMKFVLRNLSFLCHDLKHVNVQYDQRYILHIISECSSSCY